MKKLLILICSSVVLAGCADTPVPSDILARSYKQCETNGGLDRVIVDGAAVKVTAVCLNSAKFEFSLSTKAN